MNKKEKELINIFENSVKDKGDFSKIEDKIVVENTSLNNNKKRKLSFVLPLCVSFACSILCCMLIPNLLKGDTVANDANASKAETLEQQPEADQGNQESTFESAADSVENQFLYNGNLYIKKEIMGDIQLIGDFIEKIGEIEIYYYADDLSLTNIVLKVENKYYLMEKSN